MKLLKIEHPTTKNAKISRILFMIMTVLFAVYMCLLCYNDFIMASHRVQITQDAGYELVWSGMFTLESVFYLASFIYYIAITLAIFLLCLRTSLVTNCTAFGLCVGGALLSPLINSEIAEYMVCKYNVFFFLHHNDINEKYMYLKPALVLLTIAAATYFLAARLIEHKKATAQPIE